MAVCNCNYFRQ